MDWAPGHMAAMLALGANLNSVLVAGLAHWMFPKDKMGLWEVKAVLSGIVSRSLWSLWT